MKKRNAVNRSEAKNDYPEYENEVFVSYAWGGESEGIVDELELAFGDHGVRIVRDKKDLNYKGSIKAFEERIGRGQCIILVISDKYLQSEHCMYELVEVDKNQNLRNRIFPIVLSDARIYKAIDRLDYIKYWDEQIDRLNQAIKGIGVMTNLKGINDDLDKYARIRASFAHLTDLLSDMNALTPEIHKGSDFSVLINAVERAIRKPKRLAKMIAIAAFGVITIAALAMSFPSLAYIFSSNLGKIPTTIPPSILPCKVISPFRYGFDCGLSGWDKTDFFASSQAIKGVVVSQMPSRDGGQSNALVIMVDFTGPKSGRQAQGEVQVNLTSNPPNGYENQALSFKGKILTAWIFASAGSIGDKSHMNGVQLFIKDSHDRNCYSEWQNIKSEKTWFRIVWREANAALCDSGFDSSQPKILGLKIAIGENSVVTYSDPLEIYLDDVDWLEP